MGDQAVGTGGTGGTGDRRTLTDPAAIRALTHPARLTIVEYLGASGGAATATELAEIVGLSPSATSYHLRAMAKWGLVEEAEGRGDGRERMWRVAGGLSWTVEGDQMASREAREAGRALVAAVLARADERVTRWFARAADEPAEWDEVVAIFDTRLLVTSAEMAELSAAYQELLRPYQQRNRPDAPAGARVFAAHFRAVPAD